MTTWFIGHKKVKGQFTVNLNHAKYSEADYELLDLEDKRDTGFKL